MGDLFKILDSINNTKVNMLETSDDEKSYPAFMVNRGLSFHNDTIMLANEININHHLDNKLQYDFLLSAVRKKRRFSKWAKAKPNLNLDIIQEFFQCNRLRAEEALRILSKEDIERMKDALFKGGKG